MVKVNDKSIKVYNLDTINTLLIRVSTELQTLPKYLYFNDGVIDIQQFYKDINISVLDILNEIKTNDNVEFTPLFTKLEDKIIQLGLDLYSDIFVPFVVFNKVLIDMDEQGMLATMLLLLQEDLKTHNYFEKNEINLEKIWEDRITIRENIRKAISANKRENEKNIKQNALLEETQAVPYTKFELESTKFKLFVSLPNISIVEVFNLIQLNLRTPFASFNGFFKILKDYVPSKDWDISLENDIVVKICQLINVSENVKSDTYTDVIISMDEENKFIIFETELEVGKQNISQELFIESIMSIFPGASDMEIDKIEESTAKGVFYFPKSSVNNYILSDLIMNDILFSSMLAIDEHDKATKSKNSLYIHFLNNTIGKISANITEKISERGDPVLRGKDIKELFKYGSNYIRVKISYSTNQESVLLFQELFGKLLQIYNTKFTSIFDIYQNFIPNFDVKKPKEIKEIPELRLKDIEPDLFLPGYSKLCNAQPTIISDDEVEQAKLEGKKVMRYPQVVEEGIMPHNYICNYDKAPYPGLRNNPLANKDIIPYLPCCFKRDHSEVEGNIYAHYYKGEELKKGKEQKQQQNFIITNKFTPYNWYGYLPENISKMFDMIDTRENYKFIRKGVSNSKSSFLECVMEGVWKETNILNVPEKRRAKILEQKRKLLATDISAALCKQEMYDFNTEEIINMIKNPDVYLDPQYFTNLLEKHFNCNIFVFNRKNMTINAQLKLPRFLKAYYKTKNRSRCIFIYQHMGSQSDHATEPRCELIIRWKETEPDISEYSFNHLNNVSKIVKDIFEKLRLSYALTTEIKETIFPIDNSNIEIISQGIDSYGKTRLLNIKYMGKSITLLTSPIQPLSYPEINPWEITRIDEKIVSNLAKELGITLESQDIIDDYAKTINGTLGNVKISIPIIDSVPTMINNEQSKIGVNYPENNTSELENYNKYKKLSRYILAYLFWLYSKYLHNENKVVSLDTIVSFIDKFIVTIPSFEYGHVGKFFNMKSGVMKNNKLVVKSEETLKRLVYSLKLFTRQRNKLLNYYKNVSIEEYYVDLTDFDQFQFQVIVQGEDAVENWINEQKLNYKLHDTVEINMLLKPYFFKNKLIKDKIYLAQNTLSIQKAIKIANVWNEEGYNIGGDPKIDETDEDIEQPFLLFSYKNSKDIIGYAINGNPKNEDPILVGYKIGDDSFYTVLLNL